MIQFWGGDGGRWEGRWGESLRSWSHPRFLSWLSDSTPLLNPQIEFSPSNPYSQSYSRSNSSHKFYVYSSNSFLLRPFSFMPFPDPVLLLWWLAEAARGGDCEEVNDGGGLWMTATSSTVYSNSGNNPMARRLCDVCILIVTSCILSFLLPQPYSAHPELLAFLPSFHSSWPPFFPTLLLFFSRPTLLAYHLHSDTALLISLP